MPEPWCCQLRARPARSPTGAVNAVVPFGPGRVVSASSDRTVRVWRAAAGTKERNLTCEHTDGCGLQPLLRMAPPPQPPRETEHHFLILSNRSFSQKHSIRPALCIPTNLTRPQPSCSVTAMVLMFNGTLATGGHDSCVRLLPDAGPTHAPPKPEAQSGPDVTQYVPSVEVRWPGGGGERSARGVTASLPRSGRGTTLVCF